MTKDEAIHKALKILNCLNNDRVYETAWVKGAINACKEALEQPEGKEFFERGKEIARWADKQAQEPVGVVSWHEGAVMGSIFPSSNMPKDGDKLYTHPHQWQGLTDDEIVDWFEECFGHDEISETTMWFAKRLLEAVKEKNDIK